MLITKKHAKLQNISIHAKSEILIFINFLSIFFTYQPIIADWLKKTREPQKL